MNEIMFTQEKRTCASQACFEVTAYIINIVQVRKAVLYNNTF